MSSPDSHPGAPPEAVSAEIRPRLTLVPPVVEQPPTPAAETPPQKQPPMSTVVFEITENLGIIKLNPEVTVFQGLRGQTTLEPGQLLELADLVNAKRKELKKAAKKLARKRAKNPNKYGPARNRPPIESGRGSFSITSPEYTTQLDAQRSEQGRNLPPPQPTPGTYSSR